MSRRASIHRGVRYRFRQRPGLSPNLIAYFRVAGQPYERGTGTHILNIACRRVERAIDELLDGAPENPLLLQDLAAEEWRHRKKLVREGELKAATIAVQIPKLRRFLAWCHERGLREASGLTTPLLADYRSWLLHTCGHRSSSVENETLTAIRPLVLRAIAAGAIREDPLQQLVRAKKRRKVPRPYTRVEIATILRSMRKHPGGRARTRPIRFLLHVGCRRDQMRLLERSKVNLAGARAEVLSQKGDPHPVKVLPPWIVRMLARMPENGRLVFGRISTPTPNEWLKRAAADAGLPGRHYLHRLRDTWITWWTPIVGIEGAGTQAGHHDLRITRDYCAPNLAAVEARMRVHGSRAVR